MSMLVSFVLSFFPRDVLDEILNLIGSVSEGFPSYSCSLCEILWPNSFLRIGKHVTTTPNLFSIMEAAILEFASMM